MAEKIEQLPELPPELAELQHIAAAADAAVGDAAALPGGSGAPGAALVPEVDRAAELAAMLQLGVTMLAPALPFLPGCYPPAVCQGIGSALDAVAAKHGWNLDAVNSPELALAAVTIPPTVAAVVQGRAYFAAKREAAEAQARQDARQARPGQAQAAQLDARAGFDQAGTVHQGQRLTPAAAA